MHIIVFIITALRILTGGATLLVSNQYTWPPLMLWDACADCVECLVHNGLRLNTLRAIINKLVGTS